MPPSSISAFVETLFAAVTSFPVSRTQDNILRGRYQQLLEAARSSYRAARNNSLVPEKAELWSRVHRHYRPVPGRITLFEMRQAPMAIEL